MEYGEEVVRHLSGCGHLMAIGNFSLYDLSYIKQTLRLILTAVNKAITKAKQEETIKGGKKCRRLV